MAQSPWSIAWHENTDGKGTFGSPRVIVVKTSERFSLCLADIDGDGDVDVLSGSATGVLPGLDNDGELSWFENTDGKGGFGAQQVITSKVWNVMSIFATDMDGDDDTDVLVAFSNSNSSAWYENTDGQGTFSPHLMMPVGTIQANELGASVLAADVDGDGDRDAIIAIGFFRHRVLWLENIDGKGSMGEERVIITGLSTEPMASTWVAIHAADVDGDGDIDVLSASNEDNKTAWYENTDGKGDFGEQQVVSTPMQGDNFAHGSVSIYAADVDADGDMDIVSLAAPAGELSNRLTWYEQVRVSAGDANRDGEFNQLDIVQVLQAAKYLTGEPANWEEGDWNADGVFNQLDLVAALQMGNYLRGRYAADAVFAQPDA